MKLKICGLSRASEVETCVDHGVDFCGFILNYTKSHRLISFEAAQILTSIPKKNSKYVGVLVSPTNQELIRFSKLNFDYFQLYGKYNTHSLLEIKKKFKKKIISVVQVKVPKDVDKYKEIESGSDIVLWDSSGYEKSLTWNYNLIKNISLKACKMIAGNITINKIKNISNIAEIIDVSGALETNKVKDISKIKEFITEIKKLNENNKR